MYCSWYILGCHWDVCIVAGIYWAVTGMYVLYLVYTGLSLGCMYCSWYILLSLGCMYCSWYILGCHWDVCIVAGIYWAVTGMYVL